MSNLIKVVAVQDDGSHWYIIPKDSQQEFHDLSNAVYNAYNNVDVKQEKLNEVENAFNTKFSKYRTGGDLNNIQLYAEI